MDLYHIEHHLWGTACDNDTQTKRFKIREFCILFSTTSTLILCKCEIPFIQSYILISSYVIARSILFTISTEGVQYTICAMHRFPLKTVCDESLYQNLCSFTDGKKRSVHVHCTADFWFVTDFLHGNLCSKYMV